MTVGKLLERGVKTSGKKPVVILPLAIWKEIEDKLEDMEATESMALRKKIAKARAEKKLYSSAEAKKRLGI